MPAKQSLRRECRVVPLGGIEHHIHHPIDMPVSGCQSTDVDTQAPGNRRAHRLGVKFFTLDFAGLEHVLGQDTQRGLVTQIHPQVVHAAQQVSLRQVNLGKQGYQSLVVVNPVRPVLALPDVAFIFASHAVIMTRIRRMLKTTSANNAVNR